MITTLRTLFRASVAETEDAVVEANGTRLLAQHLRDAEADTKTARRALASLIARQKTEERRIDAATEEIARREQEAGAALRAEDEDLAGDLADRIVMLEEQRDQAEAAHKDLGCRIKALRGNLSHADRRIATLASELRAARAGTICRKTAEDLAEGLHPSSLERAEAMAWRVKASTQRIEDEMTAMSELRADASQDLDARLKEAGIADPGGARRKAVLARLLSKNKT